MTTTMEERMYSTNEAADALGVSSQTIRRWVKDGELMAEYVGIRRTMRITESELSSLARKHKILFRPTR